MAYRPISSVSSRTSVVELLPPAIAENARRMSRRKPRMLLALMKPMNASVRYCEEGVSKPQRISVPAPNYIASVIQSAVHGSLHKQPLESNVIYNSRLAVSSAHSVAKQYVATPDGDVMTLCTPALARLTSKLTMKF